MTSHRDGMIRSMRLDDGLYVIGPVASQRKPLEAYQKARGLACQWQQADSFRPNAEFICRVQARHTEKSHGQIQSGVRWSCRFNEVQLMPPPPLTR